MLTYAHGRGTMVLSTPSSLIEVPCRAVPFTRPSPGWMASTTISVTGGGHCMSGTPRFYVYVLTRPDGTPFYVGKGTRYRIGRHERAARQGHDCYRCRVIRKVWRDGGVVGRHVVYRTDDEAQALAQEHALIAFIGRGVLTNHTDGGEGVTGCLPYERTPEFRADAAEKARQNWTTERRTAWAAELRQRLADESKRAELSASIRRGWEGRRARGRMGWTEERRQKQRAEARARAATPEGRAQMDAARVKRWDAWKETRG